MCNTPVEVQFTSAECLNYPCRTPAEAIENVEVRLFVVGFIRYSDLNEIERFMGFCREYIVPEAGNSDGRFVAVHDPDYEYED
jgi:hypothetical protein